MRSSRLARQPLDRRAGFGQHGAVLVDVVALCGERFGKLLRIAGVLARPAARRGMRQLRFSASSPASRASASSRPLRRAAMPRFPRARHRRGCGGRRRAMRGRASAPRAPRALRFGGVAAASPSAHGSRACRPASTALLSPEAISASSSRQPVAARQPLCGGARRIGGGDIAVPAPQIAFAADQALAGLEHGLQARAVGAIDEPGSARRRASTAGARTWAASGAMPSRERAVVGRGVDPAPVRRCVLVGRRVEIVAEGSAKRRLEAAVDARPDRSPARGRPARSAARIAASVAASVSSLLSACSAAVSARARCRALSRAAATRSFGRGRRGLAPRACRSRPSPTACRRSASRGCRAPAASSAASSPRTVSISLASFAARWRGLA